MKPQSTRTQRPETQLEFAEGKHIGRIAPAIASWSLGGFAVILAAAAWTPQMDWLAWIDLPVIVLCFLVNAWNCLLDLRETLRALPGLLLSGLAVVGSTLHMVLDRSHPWSS